MVPILARYLLGIFAPTFSVSLALMTSVLLMGYFLRLFNLAVMKGIPMVWVLQCFSLLLPYLLSLAIPMAFLIGLMVSLGHLSEDGELLALRASGFGFKEILTPYLGVAVALGGLLLYCNHSLSPTGLRHFKNRYAEAMAQVSQLDPEPRTMLDLGEWKLFAEGVDRKTSGLTGVRLFKQSGNAVKVSAKGGSYRVRRGEGITLELQEGELSKSNPGDPAKTMVAHFESYRVFIPTLARAALSRMPDIQERTSLELLATLKGSVPDRDRWEERTELTLRSAIALSPLVFFWIGFPLGLRLEKQGRTWGFALSILILFAYYGLTMLGMGVGRRGPLLSLTAPWAADAACLAAGLALSRRRAA